MSDHGAKFFQQERKKERIKMICGFATQWFHTLAVTFAHAKGPANFVSIQKRQVSIQKQQVSIYKA